MCFGCSKEPSHRDGSFEYPQHMFWLRNKKNICLLHTLIWEPDGICTILLILIYYKHVSVAHMFQDAEKTVEMSSIIIFSVN